MWGQVCPSDRDCWCQGGTSPVGLISVSPRICTSGRFAHISHPSEYPASQEAHGPCVWEERFNRMKGQA